MLEKILEIERDAFFMFNGSDSIFFDRFIWLYSGKIAWIPLAVFILFILMYKKKLKESILILLAIVLVIALCDQFASHLCKPMFTRFRPTHHPDFMDQVKIVFGYRGGRYGFISSHAANAFGFATFMAMLIRNKLFTITIFIWAILMAYTRIYLGVHFISDIVPGAIVGIFFGFIVYKFHTYIRTKFIRKQEDNGRGGAYAISTYNTHLMIGGIFLTILILLTFNAQLITILG